MLLGVARWCAVHHQVQRDSIVRGRLCALVVKHEESAQWKSDARAFLLACMQQDLVEADRVKVELPQKIDRLSAFYATHMTDWQLQVAGIPGCKFFHKCASGDSKPIEHRALLIERADSYSVNCTKVHYLLHHRQSRLLPVWDFFHKRHNKKKNCYKRASVWPRIRL